ncbi:KPN_02809 family neutral zinc metallopeptidase [Nocardioides jiangxiensis]|uniref:Neutral zinc metallopeptidase n=1 Tax=Nocardioides jiangxiensis TaxID=3064524 RepID=A0ABT9B4E1_9ACTN|nr:neutral zinc metallopeptidase [Nocardioides sp. WY-20]MDO7869588.1 neutral zinc metallopeptidase [Nocardioides sp. WY-20]
MRFNPKADISGGQASGSSGGGGGFGGGLGGGGLGGLPIPGGFGIKGTIVIVILYVILSMCGVLPGPGGGSDPNPGAGSSTTETGDYASCRTGADANKSRVCERKAIMLSLEVFWKGQLGNQFQPSDLRTFSGQTQTGCGAASAQMGPFYCPTDGHIYEDPSFYSSMLEQIGGADQPFVEPYVLAHEYGHHIQDITGEMKNVRTQQGANSDSVKLELEADCYAGAWAKGALGTDDGSGQKIFESITEQDITDAIDAARAVGDDSIQKKTQGSVNPDSWTHGSSEQRMTWFKTGYSGDLNSCRAIWG